MHLLRIGDNDKELSLVHFSDNTLPKYAILSHTWGMDVEEVSYRDVMEGRAEGKKGYQKLEFCRAQALRDGLRYFWVDTCCIDKSSSAELSESINSMFRWYQTAEKCYVYLSDVQANADVKSSFIQSRWFTRGWTLQELLAPASVEFFTVEGSLIGDKNSLISEIHDCTSIPIQALKGHPLSFFSVEERMSWAEKRYTKREEDEAYSLLGILHVFMSMIYGEGREKAMQRLRSNIKKDREIILSKQVLRYYPLQESDIRVVILKPGQEGTPLSIEIDKRKIHSPVRYRAVSYAWGEQPPIHPVQVNTNEIINIRPNLYEALQRMRLLEQPLHLWIDSICIDQSNDHEKNVQVQRMGDIFRNASDVWIWLGEGDNTSGLAMELIPKIKHTSFRWDGLWYKQHNVMALNRLLERPWFSRGWVIQEAAFSANSVVFCGDSQVSAIDLAIAVISVRNRFRDLPIFPNDQATNSQPGQYCSNFFHSSAVRLLSVVEDVFLRHDDGTVLHKRLSLERLVDIGAYFETSDPRDAIYALVSLANDSSGIPSQPLIEPIIPDYTKTPLDVFAQFILHCCQTHKSLDIICRPWAPTKAYAAFAAQKNHRIWGREIAGVPTWIASRDRLHFGDPSARSASRLNGRPLLDSMIGQNYCAHHTRAPQVYIGSAPQSGVCNGSLYARGIIIGTITRQSMRMANAIVTKEALDVLQVGSGDRIGPYPFNLTGRVLCADSHLEAPSDFSPLLESGFDVEELLDQDQSPNMKKYLEAIRETVWNRRTFYATPRLESTHPLVGLAPQRTLIGDHVCILYGCSVPVVMRRQRGEEEREYWNLIGEAYAFGYMYGEVFYGMGASGIKNVEVEFEIR